VEQVKSKTPLVALPGAAIGAPVPLIPMTSLERNSELLARVQALRLPAAPP
jgi:hypothetical protein